MSSKYEQVKKFYTLGMWNFEQVKNAVVKNWITPDEFKQITGETFPEH